jgi:hypothetical protein
MLYFSYGSNMSIARLLDRVPSAKPIVTATLPGHELRFHKKSIDGSAKCDAFETGDPNHKVLGVVFEIDRAEKPILDGKEGLGFGYEEKQVSLIQTCGQEICAYTYYATDIVTGLKPYQWYKHHVLTGARENRLPEFYVERIRDIESIADQNQARHQREMAIYADPLLQRKHLIESADPGLARRALNPAQP